MNFLKQEALGFAINYAKKYMNGKNTLREISEHISNDIDEFGIDIIDQKISPNFAGFRSHEFAFTLNRLRDFMVTQK